MKSEWVHGKFLILSALILWLALSALPSAAQVTASATQLSFGSVNLGVTATQSVTLTNNGTVPVFFSGGLLASGGADFSLQTNCPDHNSPLSSGLPVGRMVNSRIHCLDARGRPY